MGKFCTNCGNKIDENAIVCVKCGVPTDNYPIKKKIPGRGLGIAGMVLGIIGTYYSVIYFIISFIMFISQTYVENEAIMLAIIFNFWPIVIGIVGLCLSIAAIKQNKLKITMAGIILNIATLFISFVGIILCKLI